MSSFEAKFGKLGLEIANQLTKFSFDVIGIISSYLKSPVATAGAKPKPLLTIDGQFNGFCYGVAVSPMDNTIWISSAQIVQIFSDEGKFLRHIAKGQWKDACGITFAANGDAYIGDYDAGHITVCRPDGNIVRRIGSRGMNNGQFMRPWYIAIDNERELLFVSQAHRVQVLKIDGSFVRTFGSEGEGDGAFMYPRGIALTAAGKVAVADRNCIQMFDCNGNFLRAFGRSGPYCGMAVDSADQLLVCDYGHNCVSVFTTDGTFITSFPKHTRAMSVHVDCDGRVLIGSDEGVVVFGF